MVQLKLLQTMPDAIGLVKRPWYKVYTWINNVFST